MRKMMGICIKVGLALVICQGSFGAVEDDTKIAGKEVLDCQFWNKQPKIKVVRLFTKDADKCMEACSGNERCLMWQVKRKGGCTLAVVRYSFKKDIQFAVKNCRLVTDVATPCGKNKNKIAKIIKKRLPGKVEGMVCKERCQEREKCLMWRLNQKTGGCTLFNYRETTNVKFSYGGIRKTTSTTNNTCINNSCTKCNTRYLTGGNWERIVDNVTSWEDCGEMCNVYMVCQRWTWGGESSIRPYQCFMRGMDLRSNPQYPPTYDENFIAGEMFDDFINLCTNITR